MTFLTRRRWLIASFGTSINLGTLSSLAISKEEPLPPDVDRAGAELITTEAQRAIRRGVDFLEGRQLRTGRAEGSFGLQGYASGVAVCSLAGLAFMASGSAPKEGPQGVAVDRCIKFVLAHVQEGGFIAGGGSNDQMYGHGLATLFLAQVFGMTLREDVGPKLRTAVKLICECQNNDGGWRYRPVKSDADLSITICQIMALRAARDAGLHVPIEVRDKCMGYVRRCQNSDGSYKYLLTGGRTTVALTAAGIVSLYSAGVYEGPEVEKAIAWLEDNPQGKGSSGVGRNYFYGQYYASQAMWQLGGERWKKWYTAIRDKFIAEQAANGSWSDASIGAEFGTAIALIILNTPNNFLPIFAK